MLRAIGICIGLTVLLLAIFGTAGAEAEEVPTLIIPITHEDFKETTVYTLTNLGPSEVHYVQDFYIYLGDENHSTFPYQWIYNTGLSKLELHASHTYTVADLAPIVHLKKADTLIVSYDAPLTITYSVISLAPIIPIIKVPTYQLHLPTIIR